MAGGVEPGPDRSDLAVHHPARGDDVRPGVGLGHGDARIQLQRGVVVDRAVAVEHPAVAVVGVLVDTQVGHQHDLLGKVSEVAEGELDDALRVVRLATRRILGDRHPEQDHPAHPERHEFVDLGAQAGAGVLDDAGQRVDRLWLVDPLAYEQRGDELRRMKPCPGDHLAHRRRTS